jgi:hypothetical protein
MTSKEAFKAGFLSRCVSEGLTTSAQIEGRLKSADISDLIGGTMKGVGDAVQAGTIASILGVGLAAAVPPYLGRAIGEFSGRQVGRVNDYEIEEHKKRELIDEFRRQTAMLKQRQNNEKGPAAQIGRPLL